MGAAVETLRRLLDRVVVELVRALANKVDAMVVLALLTSVEFDDDIGRTRFFDEVDEGIGLSCRCKI